MQLTISNVDSNAFYMSASKGFQIKPALLSLLSLRKIIDLNEICLSSSISLLHACLKGIDENGRINLKKLHLVLRSGVDINIQVRGVRGSIFVTNRYRLNSNPEAALMLFFAGANPK